MTRPTTKQDLICASERNYQKLLTLIYTIPTKDKEGLFEFDYTKQKGAHWGRDKTIRDVLVHLYEWHNLLLHWVNANQLGVEKSFLPVGYNWKNYGAMNDEFWKNHQSTSYETALQLWKTSHTQVMTLVETFSNDELFSKGQFKWVAGTTLGSYFVSATSSHYDWALKKIRRYKKSLTE